MAIPVMCTVLVSTCARGSCCPCIQIDAADLIEAVGLHVECQHCHQSQWEPNGGVGGIDLVDSTVRAQSYNQRPLRSKAMILSRDPCWEGREGAESSGSGARQQCGGHACKTLNYQRDPESSEKCWLKEVVVGRSGNPTASIWVFPCSQLTRDERLCSMD